MEVKAKAKVKQKLEYENNKNEEIELYKDITERFDLIQKNIDYCNENNMPEALEQGGKFWNAFHKLIVGTVSLEMEQIREICLKMFPVPIKQENITQIIENAINNNLENLFLLTKNANKEQLKEEYLNTIKIFANYYAELMVNNNR